MFELHNMSCMSPCTSTGINLICIFGFFPTFKVSYAVIPHPWFVSVGVRNAKNGASVSHANKGDSKSSWHLRH